MTINCEHSVHIDREWLLTKAKGGFMEYHYDDTKSLLKVYYIYRKNWLQIAYYNIILWFKYIIRLLS